MLGNGGKWPVCALGTGPAPTVAQCDKMQSGIHRPLQSRIGPEKEHVRGTLACPSESARACMTAAMFIGQLRWQSGGDSSALFRQELGLSSDSKILLIYDISTPVFSSTTLTPTDKRTAGRRWHSAKLFVCFPRTFTVKDPFPSHTQHAVWCVLWYGMCQEMIIAQWFIPLPKTIHALFNF